MEIGIKAAKTDLSRLIKAAMSGEKVVITNRGEPLVRLVPEAPKPKDPRRGFGSLKGVLNLPPGWDSPEADKEVLDMFEGLE
jgi:prevent-host-death family protein